MPKVTWSCSSSYAQRNMWREKKIMGCHAFLCSGAYRWYTLVPTWQTAKLDFPADLVRTLFPGRTSITLFYTRYPRELSFHAHTTTAVLSAQMNITPLICILHKINMSLILTHTNWTSLHSVILWLWFLTPCLGKMFDDVHPIPSSWTLSDCPKTIEHPPLLSLCQLLLLLLLLLWIVCWFFHGWDGDLLKFYETSI